MPKRELVTPVEHQVMLYVWRIAKTNPRFIIVRSILEAFPEEARPAYTTLATFIKILEKKKFLSTKKLGNLISIKPVVTQERYAKTVLQYHLDDFFDGNVAEMVKFIVENNELTADEKAAVAKAL